MVVCLTLKVCRILRLGPTFDRMQLLMKVSLTPLKILVMLTTVSHIISCLWRITQKAENPSLGIGDAWHDSYIRDLYWVLMTMTTVGYGDVGPQGSGTRIFAIVLMLFASVVFGTVVSTLSHFTKKYLEDEVEEQITKAAWFFERRGLSSDIRRRVEYNLRQRLRQEHQKKLDPALFAALSPSVQRELSLALLSSTVLQFPLFTRAPHGFVAELAAAHLWVSALPGDLVSEEGQLLTELVFLISGRLAMWSGTNPLPGEQAGIEVEVESGAWFGEACLFQTDCEQTQTTVAVLECELAVLSGKEYWRILHNHPRVMERHEEIQMALKNGSINPSRLSYRPQEHAKKARATRALRLFQSTTQKVM